MQPVSSRDSVRGPPGSVPPAADRIETDDVLRMLAVQVTGVLAVASSAVWCATEDGGLGRLVTLDEAAGQLERIQQQAHAGPTLAVLASGRPALFGGLDELAAVWPEFARLAASVGFAAMASLPTGGPGRRVGVLNLYDRSPRQWSDSELRVASGLAEMAGHFAGTVAELERQRQLSEQLEGALQSRIIIEQAKGIIAAERRIPMDGAFEVLRRYSRSHNTELRVTAKAVVELGLRP